MRIACAGALVEPAIAAGINVPPDIESYNGDVYPHWRLLCNVQVGANLPKPDVEWHNAAVISKLSAREVVDVTWGVLIERGFKR